MNSRNLERFVAGIWEQLALADADLAALEHGLFNADLASRILLTIHRIEKSCQPFGLMGIRSIANAAASVVERIRDGLLSITPEAVLLLREANAEMKELAGWVEATGAEPGAMNIDVVARLDRLAGSNRPPIATGNDASGNRVLVVDSSLFFRQLLTVALEGQRYVVTAVDSAVAAVNLFEEGKSFHAVVSEIDLREMTGYELAKWLRNCPGAQQTPLIAMTAPASAANQSRALSAGFDRVLTKFKARQLYHAMEEMLGPTEAMAERMCA
ncbi:MAG: response regulator [Planctomycetaceae bacterium]